MSDPLAVLNILQGQDLELDQLRAEQQRIPPELQEARDLHAQLGRSLNLELDNLQQLTTKYRHLDLEQKSRIEKRDRAQHFADHASTPKEINQYTNQALQLAGEVEDFDAEILPLLESMERSQTRVSDLEAKLATAKTTLDTLEGARATLVATLQEQFNEQRFKRDSLAETIPDAFFNEYEAARKARKGKGLSVVLKSGAKHKCQECNVQLPLNVVQQVFSSTPKVVRCSSCGRLLWKGNA